MADPNNRENIGQSEVVESFDIDRALNEKGFVEFLTKYPDISDPADPKYAETIRIRHESFAKLDKVSNCFKTLFEGELSTKFGIKLGDAQVKSIHEHLTRVAIKDPEKIRELHNNAVKLEELPKQIEACKSEIAVLGKAEDLKVILDSRTTRLQNIEIAQKYTGLTGALKFIGKDVGLKARGLGLVPDMVKAKLSESYEPTDEYKEFLADAETFKRETEAVAEVNERLGSLSAKKVDQLRNDVAVDIEHIKMMLSRSENADETRSKAEKAFAEIRAKLVGATAEVTAIHDFVKTASKEELEKLISGKSIESLNKAQERFESLDKAGKESELQIDAFRGDDREKTQDLINDRIRFMMFEKMYDLVNKMNSKESQLAKLEDALMPMLAETKIGSLSQETIRISLSKMLKKVSDDLGNDARSYEKRILLQHVIYKLNNNKYGNRN